MTDQESAGSCPKPAQLTKGDARRLALDARGALPAEDHAAHSAAVCERALALPELAAAHTVMLFASFRSELDTTAIVDWILQSGRVLCLPRILAPRRMRAFRIRDRETDLVPGTWDIPEPHEDAPEVPPQDIDLVFVPGSAFDGEGHRCGYGGGFYDSFLVLTRPGTPWIALAFEAQLVPGIATEDHDLPVTAIVTERRVIRPG